MSQKYVIYYKKTLSAKSQFMNKHIYLINKGFNIDKSQHLTLFNTIFIYKELQCIEVQCITLRSLALLCIEPQCITLLCITAQCIALQGIQAGDRKDPKNRVDVRTRLHTDFIDFLGFKSVLFSLAS